MEINQLGPLVKDLLVKFYKNYRSKPRKILFFRDGVSEGQFGQVRRFNCVVIVLMWNYRLF